MGPNGSIQTVPYKHMETHPQFKDGCFACKIMNVGVGSVPGGTRPGSFRLAHQRDFDQGMNEYRDARAAGIQPEGTKKGDVEKWYRKAESQERAVRKLELDGTDTSTIKKIYD